MTCSVFRRILGFSCADCLLLKESITLEIMQDGSPIFRRKNVGFKETILQWTSASFAPKVTNRLLPTCFLAARHVTGIDKGMAVAESVLCVSLGRLNAGCNNRYWGQS